MQQFTNIHRLLLLVAVTACWCEIITTISSIDRRPLLLAATSFCPTPRFSARTPRIHCTQLYSKQFISKSPDIGTDFWYSVSRHEDNDNNNGTYRKAPVVPSLDADGPLPPGCYHLFGQEQYEPKPTCSLAVSLHLNPSDDRDEPLDANQIISGMQQCIDAGLYTFQLGLPTNSERVRRQNWVDDRDKSLQEEPFIDSPRSSLQAWGEENVYGKLQSTLPRSVLDVCHLVVPFLTPPAPVDSSNVNQNSIRQSITESLSRIGAESIDTLQLEYCKGSPYHLEVMDHLKELQREGLIRSIAGKNFPPSMLRSIHGCGFRLDNHQLDCNVLKPNTWDAEQQSVALDLELPTLFSNPLAGGLLTNRFVDQRFPPLSSDVGRAASQQQLSRTLWKWALEIKFDQLPSNPKYQDFWTWNQYQKDVLPVMQSIARKYDVDVAAVALRWLFQLDQSRGVVVGCNMMNHPDIQEEQVARRIKRLRETFTFELDNDDTDCLNEIGGFDKVTGPEVGVDLGEMMSNKKLWL